MSEAGIDDRLSAITQELGDILETRLAVLAEALGTTDRLSAQIGATEIDIRRNREIQGRLGQQVSGLEEQLATLTTATDALSARRDARQQEVEAQRQRARDLEDEVRALRQTAAELAQRAETLGREEADLSSENQRLEKQCSARREQVARLKRIRDDFMAQLNDLNKQMTDLGS